MLWLLTGWFGEPSKPTKWIKQKAVSWGWWFHGWFWVPTEGWTETSPWKRKFRFSVKTISTWSLASVLNPKMWILNMRVPQAKIFLNFWNLSFQNEKMDGKWTGLPPRNNPPLIGKTPLPQYEIKNILTSLKNSKFQNFNTR